jgi:nickel superoxide dismutase
MRKTVFLTTLLLALASSSLVYAHCQMPCGIYDDQLRVELIREDATTIEKAMAEIEDSATNDNQRVRWILTKEEHAEKVQEIVSSYFLTQRIKPDTDHYAEKLAALHSILVEAMKCKQTTDVAHVSALREHLDTFTKLYFGDHEH